MSYKILLANTRPNWLSKFLCTPLGSILSKNGPWIAGGAARKAYRGLSLDKSDIDIFMNSWEQYNSITNMLNVMKNLYASYPDPERTIQYVRPVRLLRDYNGFDIQIIPFNFASSAEDLLSGFDLTVCQYAFDGKNYIASEEALLHTEENILHLVQTRKNEPSLQRLEKYQKDHGFFLPESLRDKVMLDEVAFFEQVDIPF